MNLDERINRLETFHKEGRLIRFEWITEEDDGRECACPLSAFSPEVGAEMNARACPPEAMPMWLARLTPDINDDVSLPAWDGFIARYVAMLHNLLRLSPERLKRLDYATRAIAVRESRRYESKAAQAEIDVVLSLLDRAAEGFAVSEEGWVAARAAGQYRINCARAAAKGADYDCSTTESVIPMTAASWAANEATCSRVPPTATSYEYRRVIEEVWDRMTEEFLTLWENACKETQS